MSHYAQGFELNNEIFEIKNMSKLVKFIVWFNSFCIIKHIITSEPPKIHNKSIYLSVQRGEVSCL